MKQQLSVPNTKGLISNGITNIEEMIRGVEKIKMKEIKTEQTVPPHAGDLADIMLKYLQ